MYNPYFHITPLILKNIETIGQVMGYLKAISLPTSYQQEYIDKIAAETVHASTAIEGNTLTQSQVEKVGKGQSIQGIERDIKEATNYFQVLTYSKQLAQDNQQFSQQMILDLHYQLLSGVDNTIAGKYRTGPVRVGDYIPPEAWQVPSLMADFVEWLHMPTPQGLSPILYAGIAHYQCVAIHPFQDGNGRTARALITLYLIKNKYDITSSFALESYYNRERNNYYTALSTADRFRMENGQPDQTKWLEYFTTGFLVEAQRAEHRVREYLETRQLTSGVSLNKTQHTILQITADKGTVAMVDYIPKVGISKRGIYKAVQKLVDFNLLIQSGERRGTRYTISEKGLDFLSFNQH